MVKMKTRDTNEEMNTLNSLDFIFMVTLPILKIPPGKGTDTHRDVFHYMRLNEKKQFE